MSFPVMPMLSRFWLVVLMAMTNGSRNKAQKNAVSNTYVASDCGSVGRAAVPNTFHTELVVKTDRITRDAVCASLLESTIVMGLGPRSKTFDNR